MGTVSLALVALLAFLLGTGVWICLGLLGTGVGLLTLFRPQMPIEKLLAQQAWNASTSMELLALPLFILMAEILFHTKVAESLFNGLAPWTRRLPGRMSHVTVLASTLFAAVSGSSAATTSTVGRITARELIAKGYDRSLVTGSLAGAGTLGFLIPPSTIMIIYGVLAEESILKLFMAGIVPGALLALSYMLYLAIRATLNPSLVGAPPPPSSFREKLATLRGEGLAPLLLLIVCVVGSMYGGIASPTEAASVGVLGSLLLGVYQRALSWRTLGQALFHAAQTCSMIGFIIIGAMFLSVGLGYLGLPRFVAATIQGLHLSPFTLILALLAFYVILGCFMEGMSCIVMTLPITLPLVLAAGYDKIWFGIFLVLVVELAQITPPVGFNLIVIQRLIGGRIGPIARAALPFFLITATFTLLLAVFPGIVSWLPDLLASRS
ncbi:TRAP transporter large permease subunit [Roseospira marina]|uniref:TRAP transporter large permease protein n=1 Tax=Roseospira marina TaxID=140057 RepID=A0A5M6IGZ7_9PROT|nr:TRAP transporter large permease subunit [Roseospira marina]KAA5607576.1 TRAP transporter large permease subunit [Roseospira marina]MBB4312232.1 tripartite ATP-independent transporter DctM subunit [Roseospira marina]MBB5085752.1 tripartite ATP-independent transporter DctM subunit [Roseospira marina]